MAAITCTAQALTDAATCNFQCLSGSMLQAIRIRILCSILNGESVTCDAQSLVDASTCLEQCVMLGFGPAIEIYLLCQIANNGGGGGGGSGAVVCSAAADPVAAATSSCAIFYRVDTGSVWIWNAGAAAWNKILG